MGNPGGPLLLELLHCSTSPITAMTAMPITQETKRVLGLPSKSPVRIARRVSRDGRRSWGIKLATG